MFLVALAVFYLAAITLIMLVIKHRTPEARRRILVMAILLGTPLDLAVVAEVYMRYLYNGTDTNRFFATSEKWLAKYVKKNTMGFRDNEWEPRDSTKVGSYRIGVIGSGATVGQGIEEPSDRFTDLLERQLNSSGDTLVYEVLNISELEWNTEDHTRALRQIVPRLTLDEVIVVYSMDAANDLVLTKDLLSRIKMERAQQRGWFARQLKFVDFWQSRAVAERGVSIVYTGLRDVYRKRINWDFQAARLRQLGGVRPVGQPPVRFVLLPMFAEGWEFYSIREAHAQVTATLTSVGATSLDLLEAFESTGEPVGTYWAGRYDFHPNEQAHRLIAETIYDAWYRTSN